MCKALAAMKTELSATKKKLRELESQGRQRARGTLTALPLKTDAASAEKAGAYSFSAKGLLTNRKRFGLSAGQYGRLVGASGQAVAAWEKGASKPRMWRA